MGLGTRKFNEHWKCSFEFVRSFWCSNVGLKEAYVEERLGTLGMYSEMHCDVQLVHCIKSLGMYSWYIVF